jgi:thymidylate synthase (FAD)
VVQLLQVGGSVVICQYCKREVKEPFAYHEKGDCEEQFKMLLEELKWKKFPVGSDGFVCLVDVMGDDSSIAQAARVSYGAGTKIVSDDLALVRYLYRHQHTTPFEMVEFKFLVRVPMDIWRQWIRHRMASVNEYSTRYSEAIDSCAYTAPHAWRAQSTSNKQGSAGFITGWPSETYSLQNGQERDVGEYMTRRERELQGFAWQVYRERLDLGVAKEQARKDLPLSTYTEAYWKIDLKNLMNFLSLRMDSHAQIEIRQYANAIYDIVKQICPTAMSAFDDYDQRRGGMLLSAIDMKVIRELNDRRWMPVHAPQFYAVGKDLGLWPEPPQRNRERDESLAKLTRMGIILPETPNAHT